MNEVIINQSAGKKSDFVLKWRKGVVSQTGWANSVVYNGSVGGAAFSSKSLLRTGLTH